MRTLLIFCSLALVASFVIPLPEGALATGGKYSAVKRVFDRNCVSCHSGKAPKHGLNLTTYANVMKGDRKGKIVVKGNAAKSRLAQSVKRKGPADAMPPKKKLPNADVQAIYDWIEAGCPND